MQQMRKLLPFIALLLLVSCISKHDTQYNAANDRPIVTTIPAIKDIIDHSIELSQFPDTTFFDTIAPKLIEDTNFMEFFIQNREAYYDTLGNRHYIWSEKYTYCDTAKIRKNVFTHEIALAGFEEYNVFPPGVLENFSKKIYDCGKITKENGIFLFIKYYDVQSCLYYLFSFDKNYNFLSAVCLYGYPAFSEEKWWNSGIASEQKVNDSFLNYSLTDSNLTLHIEGAFDDCYYYYFKIDEEGFFILHDNIHIDCEKQLRSFFSCKSLSQLNRFIDPELGLTILYSNGSHEDYTRWNRLVDSATAYSYAPNPPHWVTQWLFQCIDFKNVKIDDFQSAYTPVFHRETILREGAFIDQSHDKYVMSTAIERLVREVWTGPEHADLRKKLNEDLAFYKELEKNSMRVVITDKKSPTEGGKIRVFHFYERCGRLILFLIDFYSFDGSV